MAENELHGNFFEDFEPGRVFKHYPGRTITETDNIWFTLLTMNVAPLHFDREYAAKSEFGQYLVNSSLTLAIVAGMTVRDISMNAVANLSFDEVVLAKPVYVNDTIYSETEIINRRDSKSRPNAGIVSVLTRGRNQKGDVVMTFKRNILMKKKEYAMKEDK